MNDNRSFGNGSFHMLVPLKAGPELAGYLRLEMRSQRIAHLYSHAEGHLGLVALAGLLVVVGAGILLHVQLSRRSEALARALAERGARRSAGDRRARRVQPGAGGRAPSGSRAQRGARRSSAGHQRMDVAASKRWTSARWFSSRTSGLAFANARAAELLGCARAGRSVAAVGRRVPPAHRRPFRAGCRRGRPPRRVGAQPRERPAPRAQARVLPARRGELRGLPGSGQERRISRGAGERARPRDPDARPDPLLCRLRARPEGAAQRDGDDARVAEADACRAATAEDASARRSS